MTQTAPAFEVYWKRPAHCSPRELSVLMEMVILGREVNPVGLAGRVQNAERLVFCTAQEIIVGVAALKRPTVKHRSDIQEWTGYQLSEGDFAMEFGWAFVCPSGRGHGNSHRLLSCALEGITSGVFATSRADNPKIHRSMEKAGFSRAGNEYVSERHGGKMCLFIRP